MLSTSPMPFGRGLALSSFVVSSLGAWHARAQELGQQPGPAGTETLETPYVEPAPAQPIAPSTQPSPPVAPMPPQPPEQPEPPTEGVSEHSGQAVPDTRPPAPIRARRRLALTGELGWNGIAGFGPVLTYHFHPKFSADFGAGFSLFGLKGGVRARYNLLTSPFTPFVGVGFNAAGGLGVVTMNDTSDPNYDPTRSPVTVDVGPSYLVQYTFGFDFIHRRGFTMMGALGYAQLLNHTNLKVLSGELNDEEREVVSVIWGSGAVISMGFGYAWE